MTDTVKQLEHFVSNAETALQNEQDKVRRWRIQRIIKETTKKLEELRGKPA